MSSTLSDPTDFQAACPDYDRTAAFDALRATEYSYLDETGQLYLDYAGAGLPARAQLTEHAERLRSRCFGNPHSENPTSAASSELIDRARCAILDYFNAPEAEYAVIFTPNATAAIRLVAEAYPFGPRTRLLLTRDNHNSVNGIREFARARRAATRYVPFGSPALRVDDDEVRAVLRAGGRGLFAYPAQSNFSGVQHPLHWIEAAHERGYDVLLDAAAYVPSNRLDLSVVKPDFVPVSWYKVFGYPTGIGCLIARREALARLHRPWFAGGSVYVASVLADWHTIAAGEAGFEDGTVNFLHIPDVEAGVRYVDSIGPELIHHRVTCLTGWLIDRLSALRHGNGEPMVRIYGPTGSRDRGGTVAFSLLDPDGHLVDERAVGRAAADARISIRTGCFCNPGAVEAAFGLTTGDWRRAMRGGARTLDEYLALLGMPVGGALRASVGLASNVGDVERFTEFLSVTFRDQVIGTDGLAPRTGC